MSYRIEAIARLNNSTNGNPRFQFTFSDLGEDPRTFTAISQSDAAFSYEVGNPGYRVGDAVDVAFSRTGRVTRMNAHSPDYSQREPATGRISDETWSD